MATGYTAALHDGDVTFSEFALQCARAFAPLITMRDESLDAPIPDRIEPSTYSRRRLTVLIESLLEVESWDETRAELEANKVYEQAVQRCEVRSQESDARRKRYEAMIQSVEDWLPPTADHVGLKNFMREQLTKSIEYDCSGGFSEPTSRSGQEYKHYRLCRILSDIEYQTKNHREELERSEERTDWIRQLRGSLVDQPQSQKEVAQVGRDPRDVQ